VNVIVLTKPKHLLDIVRQLLVLLPNLPLDVLDEAPLGFRELVLGIGRSEILVLVSLSDVWLAGLVLVGRLHFAGSAFHIIYLS
jgi:hypothetical protein